MSILPTTLGLSVILAWGGGAFGQEALNRDYSDVSHMPKQGYPLWTAPKVAPASPGEIDLVLQDGDLVLGVVAGGEARAYPIGFFWGPAHEILNDALGGTPIAPSW
jgi:hypothetical protein